MHRLRWCETRWWRCPEGGCGHHWTCVCGNWCFPCVLPALRIRWTVLNAVLLLPENIFIKCKKKWEMLFLFSIFHIYLSDLCLCASRCVWWARLQQHRAGPWCPGCGLRQWQRTRLLAGQEQVNTQTCCSCFEIKGCSLANTQSVVAVVTDSSSKAPYL